MNRTAKKVSALMAMLSILALAMPFSAADDKVFDIAEYRGKVVVVDFWASWCVPCRRSFPWLDEMQNKYGEDGLVVVGVNMDADQGDANAFLKEYPVEFRIVNDPDGDLARQYDVIAMPSSYVIGRDGEIAARHLGFKVAKMQEYEDALTKVLK